MEPYLDLIISIVVAQLIAVTWLSDFSIMGTLLVFLSWLQHTPSQDWCMQDMNAVFGPFEIAIECNRNVQTIPNLQMMFQLKWVFSLVMSYGLPECGSLWHLWPAAGIEEWWLCEHFPGCVARDTQASQNTWWDSVHSRCNIEIPLGLHLVPDPKVPCGHRFEINGIYCNAPPKLLVIYIHIYK